MDKNALSRKDYKKIKKMDHTEMNCFIARIFQKGYEAGKKSASGLSEEETLKAVLDIKGIGEKKATDIVNALRKAHEIKEMG